MALGEKTMDPVMKSVCDERHRRIDERCEREETVMTEFKTIMHEQVEKFNGTIDEIKNTAEKNKWLLITVLAAIIADLIRGMFVLNNTVR